MNIKEIICERAFVSASTTLPLVELESLRSSARLSSYIDSHLSALVIILNASMPAILEERVQIHKQWPKDWWEAVKERFFPTWLLKRYPVEYDSIDIDRPVYDKVCPHVDLSWAKDSHIHLKWLAEEEENELCTSAQSQPLQSTGRGAKYRGHDRACEDPGDERNWAY